MSIELGNLFRILVINKSEMLINISDVLYLNKDNLIK
jgi:hypothetical protein